MSDKSSPITAKEKHVTFLPPTIFYIVDGEDRKNYDFVNKFHFKRKIKKFEILAKSNKYIICGR